MKNTVESITLMDFAKGGTVLTEEEANKLQWEALGIVEEDNQEITIEYAKKRLDEFGYDSGDIQHDYNQLCADEAVVKAAKKLGYECLPEHMSINVD